MRETLIPTILPGGLSKHTNPHHLKAWLSLHFGKRGFHVKGHFGEEMPDIQGADKMYKIWAPRKISEVSVVAEMRLIASLPIAQAAKAYAGRSQAIVGI